MQIDATTWNVFHGRDFPPDPALFTWRSWLFGIEERNTTHVQVNRNLFEEFAGVLAAARSRLGSKEVVLRGPPERRLLTLAELDPGLVVGNLHASGPSPLAAEDTRMAAEAAVAFAGDDPLILGGDFNVTPDESGVYDELDRRFGLRQPTGPHAIDHLLTRGLQITSPPTAWPDTAREVRAGDRAIRLSDHAPVQGSFGWAGDRWETAAHG